MELYPVNLMLSAVRGVAATSRRFAGVRPNITFLPFNRGR
jgi:hypothetical protein